MTTIKPLTHEPEPDPHHGIYSRTIFGFWVYIVTDFMVFATLFTTYAVLHKNVFGGPSAQDLFHLPYNLVQTILYMISSLLIGIGGACAHRKNKWGTIVFYTLAFLLGIIFFWMEIEELSRLIAEGHDWKKSAFLSTYFTLVGTHALHIVFALSWFIILIIPVCIHGLIVTNIRRLTCLRMFWQFLGIVWIFIFTVVYLLGEK